MKLLTKMLFQFACVFIVLLAAYIGFIGGAEIYKSTFNIDLMVVNENVNIVHVAGSAIFLSICTLFSAIGALMSVVAPLAFKFPYLAQPFAIMTTKSPIFVAFINWYAAGLVNNAKYYK
jgi:hypothetical protein